MNAFALVVAAFAAIKIGRLIALVRTRRRQQRGEFRDTYHPERPRGKRRRR